MIGGYIARRAVTGLVLAIVAAPVAAGGLALGPVAPAAAAPTLVIESPADGSTTRDTAPTISGSTSLDGTVTVNINPQGGQGSPQSLTALALGGSWSVTPEPLEEGTYSAVAEESDLLGETGSSAPVTFTVDTTPPGVTLSPVASPTSDPEPTLSGAAGKAEGDDPAVSVTIHEGSSLSGEVVAEENVPREGGSWSYAPPRLGDGTYTAQAMQRDAAGNVGTSAARTFTVDTTAPPVTLESVSSPTNDATPALGGSAGEAQGDAGTVSVTVYEGSSPEGEVASAGDAPVENGTWSYTPTRLADGTYTAVARQRDDAGNIGTSSADTFTIDTTPPGLTLSPVTTPSNDPTPTLSGSAGSSAGDESAVSVSIYEGTSAGGEPVASGSGTVSGGTWSYTSPHLGDGTYTARATQKDDAGNLATSAARTFAVDTTTPAVSLSSPPDGGFLATSRPTFSGGAGSASGDAQKVTLEIYAGTSTSGSPQTFSVSRSGASWSTGSEGPQLADGTYTAQVTQTDSAGNTGTSAAHTFTLRTAAPVVTLTPPPQLTREAALSFSGSADTAAGDIPQVTVKIYEGASASGNPARTLTAPVNAGAWSVGPIAALPDGTYTAVAEQKDEAGNTGASAPATFTVDTTAPAVSVSPIATATNDSTPTLKGGAGTAPNDDPTVALTIYQGSGVGGTIAASGTFTASGGTWSFTTSALPDGTYTAQATQSDEAGNTGTSGPVTFTIDTVAPVPTLDAIASPSNDSTPTLKGSAGTAGGDRASVSVKIYAGGAPEGAVVASGTVTRSGGSWSYTAPALADGTYTAQATQSDAAGNTGTSGARTFTIDTAPPQVTLNSPALRSNNRTPTFSGSASDTTPVTVKIYAGAKPEGTVKSTASASVVAGSWTSGPAGPPLEDGQYTAIAIQTSSLGNPDGKSEAVTFTVDTKAPTVTLDHPPSPSSNRTPSFTGTASDTTSVTIKVYEGETPTGTVVASATVPEGKSGSWTSPAVTPALKTGKHTYTATATQASSIPGNPSGTSAPVTFVVDTTPPTVTLDQPAALSNNRTPSFSGTASDTTSVTVKIYAGAKAEGTPMATGGASVVAGSWTSGPVEPALPSGQYTAIAEQQSSLGNGRGVSTAATFTIDATAPAVSTAPMASPTNSPTPTITGHAGTATGDEESVAVTIYGGSSTGGPVAASSGVAVEGNGQWRYVPSNLADGTYTAQATQRDAAGNTGTSAPVIFTIDTQPPAVTLESPPEHSNNVTPSFSGTASETTPVTVTVYLKGAQVATTTATPSNGSWSAPSVPPLPLKEGKNTFTATATQEDAAHNSTTTQPVTFAVDTRAPSVSLTPLRSPTNESAPVFHGTASDHTPVTIEIYAGEDASGAPVSRATASGTGGAWSSAPASPALRDGFYTAVARQESAVGNHSGETAPYTFRVDTVPPRLSLDSPPQGSSASGDTQVVSGTADVAGDVPPHVTVELFAGPGIAEGQGPLLLATVNVSAGRWTATLAGLSAGTYTVRAAQSDQAGNVGTSSPHSFTLSGLPAAGAPARAPSPPSASFTWVPASPHIGERVSLVSTSTDPTSPLSSFAWDLSGTSSFQPGGPLMITSFGSAGNHVVRLRASDAAGLSSTVSQTITVRPAAVPLMQPFPIVRIVTTRAAHGVRLKLLAVQAPGGSRMSVRCTGRACPAKSQSRVASAGHGGLAAVQFRRFERVLPVGMTLEVRVYKPGQVGKYTRLSIRRGSRPSRDDKCLAPDGVKPITCPRS